VIGSGFREHGAKWRAFLMRCSDWAFVVVLSALVLCPAERLWAGG
jgi:hypothetical protein